MEMLHVWGICDLTVESCVKSHEKHDGATGFLWNHLPSSKKALKLRPKWRGYPTLSWESTSTSRQTLHAKIGSKYIDRAATLFGDSKTENTATLLMYLLPIFAWRVCLDVDVDSQGRVGYPLHFGLNLRAFFELGRWFQRKPVAPLCSSQTFIQESTVKLQIPRTCNISIGPKCTDINTSYVTWFLENSPLGLSLKVWTLFSLRRNLESIRLRRTTKNWVLFFLGLTIGHISIKQN